MRDFTFMLSTLAISFSIVVAGNYVMAKAGHPSAVWFMNAVMGIR